jgi:hypothetical protein
VFSEKIILITAGISITLIRKVVKGTGFQFLKTGIFQIFMNLNENYVKILILKEKETMFNI